MRDARLVVRRRAACAHASRARLGRRRIAGGARGCTRYPRGVFTQAFLSLHFAVRGRVIARYTGQLLVAVASLALVPALVTLAAGRYDIALRYAFVIGGLALFGGLGARVRCTTEIQRNEALVVSALAFVVPGLALAIPIAGYGVPPLDAVFESISGVTTTGLSTLAGVEEMPASFHFARAWLQWVGGLGVLVLALAFLLPANLASKRLGFDEHEALDIVGSTRANARRILTTYLVLTTGSWLLCLATGMGAFDALVNTLSAISTGGFSNHDASLGAQSTAARAALSFVCLLGAFSFSWFLRLGRGDLRRALNSSQLHALLLAILLGAVAVGASLAAGGASSSGDAWLNGLWTSVSAQTTAGFSSLATDELHAFAKGALICQMLVGGQLGSTAGGLKIMRLLMLWKLLWNRILTVSMPAHSELTSRLDGRRIEPQETEGVTILAMTILLVIGASWLAFLAYGHDPLNALFDVTSAVGTVGLAAGTVGPNLEPALKLVLCADMLLGRVEVFSLLILLFPATWLGHRRSAS